MYNLSWKMSIYLVYGQPVFRDIITFAPDGTPREQYSALFLGSKIEDRTWRSQARWQEFLSKQGKELPSLPTLVATFIQIVEALDSKDKKLQSAAMRLRDSLRIDYEDGSLPTSTRVDYTNKTITHRDGKFNAYVIPSYPHELPFALPSRLEGQSMDGFYSLKELKERPLYLPELIALFGQRDIDVVYRTLKEIIGDEPFLVVYNTCIGENHESPNITFTDGEVRVDNVWVLRKLHKYARGVITESKAIEQETLPLEKILGLR